MDSAFSILPVVKQRVSKFVAEFLSIFYNIKLRSKAFFLVSFRVYYESSVLILPSKTAAISVTAELNCWLLNGREF
jgi:hypothetical protein